MSSPSVAYWTSALYPEMEAVAGEVALLRRHFRPSIAWGVSSSRWLQFSWKRGFGVHPRLQLAFRAITWGLQRVFRINHVFGSLGDWFHLKACSKRPTVLTVATESFPTSGELLDRVSRFVVEWPAAVDTLCEIGIDADRIEVIYPAVDLVRFSPSERPEGPFTVLFASSPERSDWLNARGIPLLLNAAQQLPAVRFRLLWRPWGSSEDVVRQQISRRQLQNVELSVGRIADMASEFRRTHATIAPFTDMSRCKAIPNSLLESLAAGRPVIATREVGLAETVKAEGCGTITEPTVDGLCEAIQCAQAEWKSMARSARQTAESQFGEERFVESYREVYAGVLARSA